MKNGKRLLCTVCAGIVALCLLLFGCSILGKKEEKVRDLTITPVSDSGLPQELQTLIKQKTSAPFKMTYTTDENLYIAVGYGPQEGKASNITFELLSLCQKIRIVKARSCLF